MSFVTILLFFLFVGLPLYSAFKKTAATQRALSEQDNGEEQDGDMLFEEDPLPFNDNEYFTYEAETVAPPVRKAAKPQPQARPIVVTATEEPVRPQFDLRQAVIAQVILSNNCISEINQQNQ